MKNFVILVLLSLSSSVFATSWTTATHFGYAIHQDEVTEFRNAGGSVLFLDVGRILNKAVSVGLRTGAQGATQGAREYYRLGAGPIVTWNFTDDWGAYASVMTFRESGLDSGQAWYRSRGQALQVGWQRRTNLSERAEVAWGGFWTKSRGRVDDAFAPLAKVDLQQGVDRGLTVALLLAL